MYRAVVSSISGRHGCAVLHGDHKIVIPVCGLGGVSLAVNS